MCQGCSIPISGCQNTALAILHQVSDAVALRKAHGWKAGAGYQPGEANFAAIEAWNAATVYEKAIAIMGRQIDGE